MGVWDEQTGISQIDDPTGVRRRGLLAAMSGMGDDSERQYDVGAMPRTSQSPRLIDRIEDDKTRHPQGDDISDVDYGGLSFPSNAPQPRDHLGDMQAEYDRLGQTPEKEPLTLKQKILRGIAAVAPAALGAAFGGGAGALAGATGTLQGFEQGRQNAQNRDDRLESQRQNQRGKLLQEIEAERRIQEQERGANQRATIQQQMETQRERDRQASQERLFGQQSAIEAQREAARQQTLKQQMDEQNQRQSAQFGEQEKLQGMRDAATDRRQVASDTRRDKSQDQKWQGVASKRYETAMDSEQRLSRMEASYKEAVKGDQQAMLALLTDHIGMTLGLQKGARITKDILQEATASQPWLAKIESKFDDRGYLSGVTLGKDQMRQMLQLGYGARDRAVQGAYDDSQLYGVQPPKGAAAVFGRRKMGDMPALQGGDGGMVTMRAPNGQTKQVPSDQVEHYKSIGATVVSQ